MREECSVHPGIRTSPTLAFYRFDKLDIMFKFTVGEKLAQKPVVTKKRFIWVFCKIKLSFQKMKLPQHLTESVLARCVWDFIPLVRYGEIIMTTRIFLIFYRLGV